MVPYYIYATTVVALFWGVRLLLVRENRRVRARRIIGCLMLLMVVNEVCNLLSFHCDGMVAQAAFMVKACVLLSVGPMIALFANSLTITDSRWAAPPYLFLPSLVYWLVMVGATVMVPDSDWFDIVCNDIFRIVITGELMLAGVWGELSLRDYSLLLDEYYSDTDRRLTNCRTVIIFCWVLVPLVLVVMIYPNAIYGRVTGLFVSLATCVVVSGIGLFSQRISYSNSQLMERIEEEERAAGTVPEELPAGEDRGLQGIGYLQRRLEAVMEGEQLFLDPGLSLVKLSRSLYSNRKYTSQLIHNSYGMTFSQYVNGLRVRYAKDLIVKDKRGDDSLAEISRQSGFSSYSAFYRNFCQIEGKTPSQWLADQRRRVR